MFNTNTFHTVGDNEVTHRSVSEHFLFEMYTTDGELELDQNGRKNWFSFRPGSMAGSKCKTRRGQTITISAAYMNVLPIQHWPTNEGGALTNHHYHMTAGRDRCDRRLHCVVII